MFYVSDEIASKSESTLEVDISELSAYPDQAKSTEEFLAPHHGADRDKVVLFGKVVIAKSA
jgi:hypothetical protein